MGLFGVPRRRKLKPTWTLTTGGVIWQLMPDRLGHLLGEERDLDRKTVTFFCVNRRSGELRWSGLSVGERWWVGMDTVQGGTLFLHGYATPDLPGHKGVTAIDIPSGRLLWNDPDLEFRGADGEQIVASQGGMTGQILMILDGRSGRVKEMLEADDPILLQVRAKESLGAETGMILPAPWGEGDASSLRRLLDPLQRPQTRRSPLAYLSVSGAVIVAFHESLATAGRGQASLRTVLNVFHAESGRVLFHDVLASHVDAPIADPFFVLDGMLCYVKERRVLTAVALP